VQDVVDQPFPFIVGQSSPIQPALLGEFDDAWFEAVDDSMESRRPGNQPQNGLTPSFRRKAFQAVQNLLLADLDLRHVTFPSLRRCRY
jgi:hypothetical protein